MVVGFLLTEEETEEKKKTEVVREETGMEE